jgi:hypothetical protein
VQRASVLAAFLEDCETQWLQGKAPDVTAWFVAIDRQRRLLEVLGLERRAKDVTTLSNYLARKERN